MANKINFYVKKKKNTNITVARLFDHFAANHFLFIPANEKKIDGSI